MKNLRKLLFKNIDPDKTYIIIVDVYEGSEKVIKGSGYDAIEILKKSFLYDEDEDSNLNQFLQRAESLNGDGFDYVRVFLL